VKAEPSEPQGTQKSRVAKKKEQAGAKPKKGAAPAQKDQPHIAEALKVCSLISDALSWTDYPCQMHINTTL
jgi:hypothetical protein